MTVFSIALRVIVLALLSYGTLPMRNFRPWTVKHWCESVVEPHWPFAYSKRDVATELTELKGRVTSSLQNMGHVCATRGSLTKCHRCENIRCEGDKECKYQIQGVDWSRLARNVPTVSDVPFAVGGVHRSDFGGSSMTHVCLMLSGGGCIRHHEGAAAFGGGGAFDYRSCRLRCWGSGAAFLAGLVPKHYALQQPDPMPDRFETVGWEYSSQIGNPQGQLTLHAGTAGEFGHRDGTKPLFHQPMGVAVDALRNVYVVDHGNHCIRRIGSDGQTTTIAGVPGESGSRDGAGAEATFDSPVGITLYYDWGVKYDLTGTAVSNGIGELVLVVGDTGNHRLRRILLGSDGSIAVSTLSGRRGLPPMSGYSDGDPTEARFSFPSGVAADHDGTVYVADRDNHLVRRVTPDGQAYTLAGTTAPANEHASLDHVDTSACAPPCMRGVAGYRDGTRTEARFSYPSDVAIGPELTVLVVDGHRLRRVTRQGVTSTVQGVTSSNRVVTVAGNLNSGFKDGVSAESSFNTPHGVFMTDDSRVYVADTLNCRVRRVASAELTSRVVSCASTGVDVVRPSGCSSYDPPVDAMDMKTTDTFGSLHYNHFARDVKGELDGWTHAHHAYNGRRIQRCQGTPPVDAMYQSNGNTLGPRLGTGAEEFTFDEDTDQGTSILVSCPSRCVADGGAGVRVVGGAGGVYTDESQLCAAAVHAGAIDDSVGGIVTVHLSKQSGSYVGSSANGVTSSSRDSVWARSVRFEPYLIAQIHVDTIAGVPAAPLQSACGASNVTQPPMAVKLSQPAFVAAFRNSSLTNTNFMYIADTANHVVRKLTAVCSKTCENLGVCIGPDLCSCAEGWSGDDCTVPICSTTGPSPRHICVAPQTWGCIPGYSGADCRTPLCVQNCEHGGVCSAPDTCSCVAGWFDANCTTPVCSQTCGNGANCTAPNTCTCPTDWSGADCRTPVCRQQCLNGATCTAPDTCTCAVGWSGHDCGLPPVSSSPATPPERCAARPTPPRPIRMCRATERD